MNCCHDRFAASPPLCYPPWEGRNIMTRLLARIAFSVFVLGCGGSSSSQGPAGSGGSGGTSPADSGISGGTGTGDSGSGGTGPIDNCSDFSGPYSVTTEIVSTTCPLGLHVTTPSITWTFAQTAPSCSFTMTNSLYPSSQYSGYFTMVGTQATVTWTSVAPAPAAVGGALTYTGENLTIGPGAISGSFAWNSAYPCTGTTNVCNGSAVSDCLIPN
jgi:hypothetical protein